jgi:hypothetical protein
MFGCSNESGLLEIMNAKKQEIKDFSGASPNFSNVARTLDLCIYSMPFGKQETDALVTIGNSLGEASVSFPYPNLPIEDQPNLFFEFLSIYRHAQGDYREAKTKDGT